MGGRLHLGEGHALDIARARSEGGGVVKIFQLVDNGVLAVGR